MFILLVISFGTMTCIENGILKILNLECSFPGNRTQISSVLSSDGFLN